MGFLYSQLFKSLPYPTGSYAGKTIIVTGSNVGLGKEAARHFARLGASRLILAVRTLEKGEAAREEIEASTNCGKGVIQVWQIDMTSYMSVQSFARRVNSDLDRVDIFLANAGVARSKYHLAEDNECGITVNVVSTFLLCALVIPKMKQTATRFNTRPTFTITSSETHGHTKFSQQYAPEGEIFNTINDKKTAEASWDDMYPISKLLEVYVVRQIAKNHPASELPVTINCVNPGLCQSELSRDQPTFMFWLIKKLLARSTEVGSRTLVHACSQGAEAHGQYLSDCSIVMPASVVTSADGQIAQERVTRELIQKLEKIRPGVTQSLS